MQERIGVGLLKDIKVLYGGDIYDMACLLLKIHDAKNKGTEVVYLGDSAPDEHTIVFHKGEMIDIICPLQESEESTGG